jgi:hypothetical protein
MVFRATWLCQSSAFSWFTDQSTSSEFYHTLTSASSATNLESLVFWTLSIIHNTKEKRNNVLEIGCFSNQNNHLHVYHSSTKFTFHHICLLHTFLLPLFDSACCQVLVWLLLNYMGCQVTEANSKGPNRAGVSLPSMEAGPVSETLFYIYLQFQMMNTVTKPNDSECYTPKSEPFRFYLLITSLITTGFQAFKQY